MVPNAAGAPSRSARVFGTFPDGLVVPETPTTFSARGEGPVVTAKSLQLESVSLPFGLRTIAEPGAAVVGGAGAGQFSSSALVAAPQPTLSTSNVPVASLRLSAPLVADRFVANVWSAAGEPV